MTAVCLLPTIGTLNRTAVSRAWHDAASFTVMFDEGDWPEPRTVVLARLTR